jgi:hypothetical protein
VAHQLTGIRPSGIKYMNAEDDPRNGEPRQAISPTYTLRFIRYVKGFHSGYLRPRRSLVAWVKRDADLAADWKSRRGHQKKSIPAPIPCEAPVTMAVLMIVYLESVLSLQKSASSTIR